MNTNSISSAPENLFTRKIRTSAVRTLNPKGRLTKIQIKNKHLNDMKVEWTTCSLCSKYRDVETKSKMLDCCLEIDNTHQFQNKMIKASSATPKESISPSQSVKMHPLSHLFANAMQRFYDEHHRDVSLSLASKFYSIDFTEIWLSNTGHFKEFGGNPSLFDYQERKELNHRRDIGSILNLHTQIQSVCNSRSTSGYVNSETFQSDHSIEIRLLPMCPNHNSSAIVLPLKPSQEIIIEYITIPNISGIMIGIDRLIPSVDYNMNHSDILWRFSIASPSGLEFKVAKESSVYNFINDRSNESASNSVDVCYYKTFSNNLTNSISLSDAIVIAKRLCPSIKIEEDDISKLTIKLGDFELLNDIESNVKYTELERTGKWENIYDQKIQYLNNFDSVLCLKNFDVDVNVIWKGLNFRDKFSLLPSYTVCSAELQCSIISCSHKILDTYEMSPDKSQFSFSDVSYNFNKTEKSIPSELNYYFDKLFMRNIGQNTPLIKADSPIKLNTAIKPTSIIKSSYSSANISKSCQLNSPFVSMIPSTLPSNCEAINFPAASYSCSENEVQIQILPLEKSFDQLMQSLSFQSSPSECIESLVSTFKNKLTKRHTLNDSYKNESLYVPKLHIPKIVKYSNHFFPPDYWCCNYHSEHSSTLPIKMSPATSVQGEVILATSGLQYNEIDLDPFGIECNECTNCT